VARPAPEPIKTGGQREAGGTKQSQRTFSKYTACNNVLTMLKKVNIFQYLPKDPWLLLNLRCPVCVCIRLCLRVCARASMFTCHSKKTKNKHLKPPKPVVLVTPVNKQVYFYQPTPQQKHADVRTERQEKVSELFHHNGLGGWGVCVCVCVCV